MNAYNKADAVLNVLSATVGLSMIQDVMGIIIMVLTGINIVFKLYLTIKQRIKDKNPEGIPQDIENTINELNDLNKKEDK